MSYDTQSTEPAAVDHVVGIEGTGADDPTLLVGRTVTVTRLGAVGKYRVTFLKGPGTFVDAKAAFQASTPSDVAGYSVAFGDFVPPTDSARAYIDFWVYDATPALDDLEDNWKLRLTLTFKTVDV